MNFERNNDPLESMNIGLNRTDFDSEEQAIEILIIRIPILLKTREIPKDILGYEDIGYINPKYYNYFKPIIKNITIKGEEKFHQLPGKLLLILKNRLEELGFKKEKFQ
jgi:hypothetical protein